MEGSSREWDDQTVKDLGWGEIDYLVVDAPPGTLDEHISTVKYLQATGADGAIIVSTPQQVSLIDVRKEINFCKKVDVPVLGVVENMSGLRQAFSVLKLIKPGAAGEMDATEWAMYYVKENAPELLSVVACSEVFDFDSPRGDAETMCHEMGGSLFSVRCQWIRSCARQPSRGGHAWLIRGAVPAHLIKTNRGYSV